VEIEKVDELHNRLDQILNDNLDERLPGLRHRAVPRSDGKYFYVIQVPASYLAPHMITMPSTKPRFYLRVNTVNAPMNAQQIKDASLHAQNRAPRIRTKAHRVERSILWCRLYLPHSAALFQTIQH
jgi:hypothetical protein